MYQPTDPVIITQTIFYPGQQIWVDKVPPNIVSEVEPCTIGNLTQRLVDAFCGLKHSDRVEVTLLIKELQSLKKLVAKNCVQNATKQLLYDMCEGILSSLETKYYLKRACGFIIVIRCFIYKVFYLYR